MVPAANAQVPPACRRNDLMSASASGRHGVLTGLEEDEPQRQHIGGGMGKRPLHGELPANILVGAGSAGDRDRKGRAEVGLALDLNLPVPKDHGPVAQHVEPALADRDIDAVDDAAVNWLAVLEVGRGLDHLVARASALLADVDHPERLLVADQV